MNDLIAKIIKNNKKLMSIPTWDELLEIEYVRRFYCVNMFVYSDVIDLCQKLKLHNALEWMHRLKENHVSLTNVFDMSVKHYVKNGPIDKWLTDDIVSKLKEKANK